MVNIRKTKPARWIWVWGELTGTTKTTTQTARQGHVYQQAGFEVRYRHLERAKKRGPQGVDGTDSAL